jgi:hypothetical protein
VRDEFFALLLYAPFTFTFEQTGDFRSAGLPLDFRRNVMPIFKEAFHNAIREGGSSLL